MLLKKPHRLVGGHSSAWRWITVLLLSLLVMLLVSCAGGTSGTGGRNRQFNGTVTDSNNKPVAGITVTLIQTGDTAVTDENGDILERKSISHT